MTTAIPTKRHCQCGLVMARIKDVYLCDHCDTGFKHAPCIRCVTIDKKPGLGPKTGR